MALHENGDQNKWSYLRVDSGKLMLYEGQRKPEKPLSAVDGALATISLFMDGAPGYEAKLRLRIVLADGDERYVIKSGAETAFGRMFAGYLDQITKGQHIKIRVIPGTENSKVTSCFIEEPGAGDSWMKVPYSRIRGSDEAETDQLVIAKIQKHDAFEVYTPKGEKDGTPPAAPAAGAGVPDQFQIMSVLVRAIGEYPSMLPRYDTNVDAYWSWIRKALAMPMLDANTITHDQALRVVQAIHDRGLGLKPLPAALQGLKPAIQDDYDPFADDDEIEGPKA